MALRRILRVGPDVVFASVEQRADPASEPGGLEGAPRYLGSTTLTVLLWFEMT